VHDVGLDPAADVVLDGYRTLPAHPNAMTLEAFDAGGAVLARQVSYSVGGGFVVTEGVAEDTAEPAELPHPFRTAADLLGIVERTGLTIAEIAFANERARRPSAEVRSGLLHIAEVMRESIERGLRTEGVLPGGLDVPRRAPALARRLAADSAVHDPMRGSDWLALFAMAVNEQNAAGERVVTAPTNGAAGIIPAVLEYHRRFDPAACADSIVDFLLTAVLSEEEPNDLAEVVATYASNLARRGELTAERDFVAGALDLLEPLVREESLAAASRALTPILPRWLVVTGPDYLKRRRKWLPHDEFAPARAGPAAEVVGDRPVLAVPPETGHGGEGGALILIAASPQEARELAGRAVDSRLSITIRG
jgi:hypothetical protein